MLVGDVDLSVQYPFPRKDKAIGVTKGGCLLGKAIGCQLGAQSWVSLGCREKIF